MTKAEYRKKYINLRDSLSPVEISRKSSAISRRVFETDEYNNTNLVLVYYSVGSEFRTNEIITRAFADGKRVALVKIIGKELEFVYIEPGDGHEPGLFGIPTAPGGNETVRDYGGALCITPALSISRELDRLGYGGGYFDRFFARHPETVRMCCCFDECVSDTLPSEEYDIKADICVTETGMFGGDINGRRK